MTEHQLLLALCRAQRFLSVRKLSESLGVSRAAIFRAVCRLRRGGYRIDFVPGRGYRLRSEPEVLQTGRIRALLHGNPWRERITVLFCVDTTNNYAKTLAQGGAPEGTCVLAERQTAGRGRRGRSFVSDSGGLYFSCILRPDVPPQQLLHLTALAAVSVTNAIEAVTGLSAQIKWPNDPVINGKKVCGILTEMSLDAEHGDAPYIILGIGINCNQPDFPPELREIATSLLEQTGAPVDRNALAAALIRELSALSGSLLSSKQALLRTYSARCITLGREIVIMHGDEAASAYATGIGDDAQLLVRYADGTTGAVNFGEVSVRGMYGYT